MCKEEDKALEEDALREMFGSDEKLKPNCMKR